MIIVHIALITIILCIMYGPAGLGHAMRYDKLIHCPSCDISIARLHIILATWLLDSTKQQYNGRATSICCVHSIHIYMQGRLDDTVCVNHMTN